MTGCSPSPGCLSGNGRVRVLPTQSNGSTRSSKRRIKTQTVLPSADNAAMLFWGAPGRWSNHNARCPYPDLFRSADEPIPCGKVYNLDTRQSPLPQSERYVSASMSTVARSDSAADAALKPLEFHMRRIVHHELGEPARVLRVEDGPSAPLGPDQVRVRVSYTPIHPGDLLGIVGSPAFGTPPTITSGGRVPGFEGAGVVREIGAKVDPALGLQEGLRVAFFPASGAWSDEAVVPASSAVLLPDSLPDEVGAQMLINTLTALTAIRAAHDSLPSDARTGVVTLLTGAGSAVGRLIGKLLAERGVKVIGLVRGEASAACPPTPAPEPVSARSIRKPSSQRDFGIGPDPGCFPPAHRARHRTLGRISGFLWRTLHGVFAW